LSANSFMIISRRRGVTLSRNGATKIGPLIDKFLATCLAYYIPTSSETTTRPAFIVRRRWWRRRRRGRWLYNMLCRILTSPSKKKKKKWLQMIYYDVAKRSSWPYYIIYYYYTFLYFALKLSPAIWVPSSSRPSSHSQRGSRPYIIIELNDPDESFGYVCESYLPWSAHTPRGRFGRELVGRNTTTQNTILFIYSRPAIRSKFSVNILFFCVTHNNIPEYSYYYYNYGNLTICA